MSPSDLLDLESTRRRVLSDSDALLHDLLTPKTADAVDPGDVSGVDPWELVRLRLNIALPSEAAVPPPLSEKRRITTMFTERWRQVERQICERGYFVDLSTHYNVAIYRHRDGDLARCVIAHVPDELSSGFNLDLEGPLLFEQTILSDVESLASDRIRALSEIVRLRAEAIRLHRFPDSSLRCLLTTQREAIRLLRVAIGTPGEHSADNSGPDPSGADRDPSDSHPIHARKLSDPRAHHARNSNHYRSRSPEAGGVMWREYPEQVEEIERSAVARLNSLGIRASRETVGMIITRPTLRAFLRATPNYLHALVAVQWWWLYRRPGSPAFRGDLTNWVDARAPWPPTWGRDERGAEA